jgi:hypothetical protein
VRRALSIAVLLVLVGAGSAHAAWKEIVGGPSPINFGGTGASADDTTLASVGGVPYVVWTEYDGTNREVRVARLNAAGTAWERVADSPSPINQAPNRNADDRPEIADIGGVPYVTWAENDGTNEEIRVARLNAAGTAWEKVGQTSNPASPLNLDPNREALDPVIASINGAPFVAWTERDAAGAEIRVARLNAQGTGWGFVTGGSSPINQNPDGAAFEPDLASVGGVPYVTWREYDGVNTEIRVARLNAAGNAWEKVGQQGNPASPINESSAEDGDFPSLASINGVPYVAWEEDDGSNLEIRVARLNAAGDAWEKVGQATSPASPINQSASEDGEHPELTAIDGVPYVTFRQDVATEYEIHVARLNAAGTDWENVAGPPAPIDRSASTFPADQSLAVVGGVPYLAWTEYDAQQTESQARVTRLDPEFVGQSATPGPTGATLSATWKTYGLAYPIGFEYGASLEAQTALTPASIGSDPATVTQQVSGLAEQSSFGFRSFALPGVEPRLFGEPGRFTTTDGTAPETTITKDPPNKLKKSKAKYRFTSSEPNSTFVCKFDKKKPKPCDAGKFKAKRLDDGKHKFRVYAVDAAGNKDASPAKDKFKVL